VAGSYEGVIIDLREEDSPTWKNKPKSGTNADLNKGLKFYKKPDDNFLTGKFVAGSWENAALCSFHELYQ
jgi:hypothetical protein